LEKFENRFGPSKHL